MKAEDKQKLEAWFEKAEQAMTRSIPYAWEFYEILNAIPEASEWQHYPEEQDGYGIDGQPFEPQPEMWQCVNDFIYVVKYINAMPEESESFCPACGFPICESNPTKFENQIAKQKIEEYIEQAGEMPTDRIVGFELCIDYLDQGGDPLALPDATWEELGRGFIANEPDMSEGGE